MVPVFPTQAEYANSPEKGPGPELNPGPSGRESVSDSWGGNLWFFFSSAVVRGQKMQHCETLQTKKCFVHYSHSLWECESICWMSGFTSGVLSVLLPVSSADVSLRLQCFVQWSAVEVSYVQDKLLWSTDKYDSITSTNTSLMTKTEKIICVMRSLTSTDAEVYLYVVTNSNQLLKPRTHCCKIGPCEI